jgi:antitoxin Phd
MSAWPVQDAKARFSEMLDNCLNEGPQVISRRGVAEAVLVPIDQWRRLQGDAPTLKDLLLSDHTRADIPVPARGGRRRRAGAVFA